MEKTNGDIPGFRTVPKTGVIYVSHRAIEEGFDPTDTKWANLGQGAPEVGPLPGAPTRRTGFSFDARMHEYSPVEGERALRQKVADLYNALFRKGKSSQYTYENVAIASGGRPALTRIAASFGEMNLGHFIPDYTAYEELLGIFRAFIPIPILLDPDTGYKVGNGDLRKEILGRGLKAILLSNPCNPTGQVIAGDDLSEIVAMARECHCSCILDEFYSHYIYLNDPEKAMIVSAAAFVEDVNQDPVVIVDGVTKNWRYPGWRISWTLGPRSVIQSLASAGSFLDGGPNHPFQHEVLDLLDPEHVFAETRAIQTVFSRKRNFMLERLSSMGIRASVSPKGAFYVWADLSLLPPPLNDGLVFFEEGLKHKIVTVPGIFFDVNPGKRRENARFQSFSRISFGPAMEVLSRGLDAMERMITSQKRTILMAHASSTLDGAVERLGEIVKKI